jgi:spore coat polysaccharide biosynthesis protein SpsF
MAGTVAIIQARMGSTRFPGKILCLLSDKHVVEWVFDRVMRASSIDRIVLATTDRVADQAICDIASLYGIDVFRGSEDDVLGRFWGAASQFEADWIVRVNADNPLIDPQYIDSLVDKAQNCMADYASYRLGDGTPVMLSSVSFFAEVISKNCLEHANSLINDHFQREHVTLGIYTRPNMFNVHWLQVPGPCDDTRLRFTLDTPADLELLREVVETLGGDAPCASAEDICQLLPEHPEWLDRMFNQSKANPKNT